MKKLIPILFMFFIVYSFNHKEEIIIPDYAIRFRVIANSNSMKDQELKMMVKNSLEKDLDKLMVDAKNKEDAVKIINSNLENIRKKVDEIVPDNKVNFGLNYFPSKTYYGVNYDAGEYDSLVVTLGNGLGNNWWCVMFPPLCLIEGKDNNSDNIEYRLLIKDILDKYS